MRGSSYGAGTGNDGAHIKEDRRKERPDENESSERAIKANADLGQ